MTTTTLPSTAIQPEPPKPLVAKPILVASDGTDAAEAALRAARGIAGRASVPVSVISVVEPLPIVSPEVQIPLSPDVEAERRALRVRAVRAQMRSILGDEAAWPLELAAGNPAATVANRARQDGAGLIVVGLGRHGVIDRLFGSETALHLLRMSSVPVLAVPPRFGELPTRAVVAMDFSDCALGAARFALALLPGGATVALVHVISRELMTSVWSGLPDAYSEAIETRFSAVREMLETEMQGRDIRLETATLHGDPARELLHFAAGWNAELIVTGSHGYGLLSRMLLGSVATKLVRGAECAVLGVPLAFVATEDETRPGPGATAAAETGAERDAAEAQGQAWTATLTEFTRRNVGRRCTLEVDDPELGAQAQVYDYPLLGVTYDHHDRRVDIMLGDLGGGSADRHLTRGIGGVTSVDVLRDAADHDAALRVRHGAGGGQTLLTLAR